MLCLGGGCTVMPAANLSLCEDPAPERFSRRWHVNVPSRMLVVVMTNAGRRFQPGVAAEAKVVTSGQPAVATALPRGLALRIARTVERTSDLPD